MASPKLKRRGGLFAMLGSLLWTVTWILVLLTGGGGTRAERSLRTLLLNPAMLLFMGGLAGLHARQAGQSGRLGKTGLAVCLLGTGTMLLGNVVEFWGSEYFYGTQRPGWVMMGVGLMMLPAGFIVLGIGTLRARVFTGWRRAVPLGVGLMLALIVVALMAAIWSTSQQPSKSLVISTIFAVPLGWTALGYALWSEKAESSDTAYRMSWIDLIDGNAARRNWSKKPRSAIRTVVPHIRRLNQAHKVWCFSLSGNGCVSDRLAQIHMIYAGGVRDR